MKLTFCVPQGETSTTDDFRPSERFVFEAESLSALEHIYVKIFMYGGDDLPNFMDDRCAFLLVSSCWLDVSRSADRVMRALRAWPCWYERQTVGLSRAFMRSEASTPTAASCLSGRKNVRTAGNCTS